MFRLCQTLVGSFLSLLSHRDGVVASVPWGTGCGTHSFFCFRFPCRKQVGRLGWDSGSSTRSTDDVSALECGGDPRHTGPSPWAQPTSALLPPYIRAVRLRLGGWAGIWKPLPTLAHAPQAASSSVGSPTQQEAGRGQISNLGNRR